MTFCHYEETDFIEKNNIIYLFAKETDDKSWVFTLHVCLLLFTKQYHNFS
jgi:hypothetical protein